MSGIEELKNGATLEGRDFDFTGLAEAVQAEAQTAIGEHQTKPNRALAFAQVAGLLALAPGRMLGENAPSISNNT